MKKQTKKTKCAIAKISNANRQLCILQIVSDSRHKEFQDTTKCSGLTVHV